MRKNREVKKYFGKDLEVLACADNYYLWILKEFSPYIGERLVDVGAGSGTFSRILLKTKPLSLLAIEPSDNVYPLLVDTLGREPVVTTHKGMYEEEQTNFKDTSDTVFYINVLEHIRNDEAELRKVWASLRPGGHICIFVPALSYLYGSFDKNVGHFRRYSKRDLVRKLTKAGFNIEKVKYMDIVGIIPWWLSFCVFKRESLGGKQVFIYDRFFVPVIRLLESIVSPPIGKNLLIVGKKVHVYDKD